MTRNYVVLFLFLLFIFTSVSYGIAGPYGMLVNRQMAKQVEQEEHELSVMRVSLNNVQHRLDSSWTQESLLDNARLMGYVQPGEVTYFFFDNQGNPQYPEATQHSDGPSNLFSRQLPIKRPITSVSLVFCLIISLLASSGITGVLAFRYSKQNHTQVLVFNGDSHGNNTSKK